MAYSLELHELNNGWPHQVIVPAYRCTGRAYREQLRFGEALSMCSHVGAVRIGDTLYRIFRFRDRQHARLFESRFDGTRYLAVGARRNVTMIPVLGVVR